MIVICCLWLFPLLKPNDRFSSKVPILSGELFDLNYRGSVSGNHKYPITLKLG